MELHVKLLKTTSPKFMHNASKAGKLPVWTFQFEDQETKKKGEVDISMTTNMTKDENTAKKGMADAALKDVRKNYPKATVKMV